MRDSSALWEGTGLGLCSRVGVGKGGLSSPWGHGGPGRSLSTWDVAPPPWVLFLFLGRMLGLRAKPVKSRVGVVGGQSR